MKWVIGISLAVLLAVVVFVWWAISSVGKTCDELRDQRAQGNEYAATEYAKNCVW